MRSTGQPQLMPRVHKAPPGFFYAPMPDKVVGTNNRVLQGGNPPVPYRAQNNWSGAGRYASEPFASKQIKGEIMAARRDNE